MNLGWLATYVSLPISLFSLVFSVKALRESRWDRLLVTVEGSAYSVKPEGKDWQTVLIVEVTNVGRTPTTVTDAFWRLIPGKKSPEEVYEPSKFDFKDWGSIGLPLGTEELPIILQPNSSHRFTKRIPMPSPTSEAVGRPGVTVIKRPKSPRKVSHESTRTNVFGKERRFPQRHE